MATGSKKLLKIVKADQTVHFVPLANKAQFMGQNALLPSHQKWAITEVDAAEAVNHKWKDTGHVTGAAASVVAEKDKEIARLRAALAAKFPTGAATTASPSTTDPTTATGAGAATDPGASTAVGKSTDEKADVAIAKIGTLTTEADINAYIDGEGRSSVVKAANKRIEAVTV